MHGNHALSDRVVDGIGKTLGKRPVKSMTNGMNASMNCERIDIRVQRIQEIISEILLSLLIEFESIFEVEFCLIEDSDSHDTRSRISFLATSQSVNRWLPSSIPFCRSARTSPCQSGGANPDSELLKSAQISSIARIFSAVVISFKGKTVFIQE